MLKNQQSENSAAKSMTIQNLDSLDASSETMCEKSNKNGHISFSVASLLADTRPANRSTSPVSQNSSNLNPNSSPQHQSSDEEYDSNAEDSIVDVEDLNVDQKDENSSIRDNEFIGQREFNRENVLNSAPIRPTPFSALAAAVYQAAHPNWSHQSLVNPFGGPGPMFQGPTPFGVPNMNSGNQILFFFYSDMRPMKIIYENLMTDYS
ncbi:hypothetical protein MML48_5g00012126 [Holotrichia oblita]|uniref:Uncharacterized protein n=1 Tax=Holotrichia oblita TaxID=644536 RepID=A0ACB9T1P4_HOLOL|nr:hypothetical protein MML48_5g00012126 [Holotrichia oblita]